MNESVRFFRLVDKTEGCWEWKGTKYRRGYGHFRRKVGGQWKMYKAHRFSYEYHKGPIPEGLLVLHSCDNPSCVNPDHLFVGTHQDNTTDMIKKGRFGYPRNPKHQQLSLSFAQKVRKQKEECPEMRNKEIAQLFGISCAQSSRILNHKTWPENQEGV